MNRIRRLVCLAVVVTLPAVAVAQSAPKRKPGLWEITMATGSAGMTGMPDMQELLAQMPPEKRAQMEQMMKSRGMAAGGGPGGGAGMTQRYCVTPQQAAEEPGKGLYPRPDRASECQHKVLEQTATQVRFSASCRLADGSTATSEGRIYDMGPDHYSLEMRTVSSQSGTMTMQQTAKWVSADCGGLKPSP